MKVFRGCQKLWCELHLRKAERLRKRRERIAQLIREYLEYHQKNPGNCADPLAVGPKLCIGATWGWQHPELLKKHQEFHHYYRHLRYIRPLILLFNLLVWYLIFYNLGVKTTVVFFAILISLGGIYELYFLKRLEKRVFEPIDQLKKGVEEIARGNYDVEVECDVFNDLTLLVASFNHMARRLQEGEKIKAEYEENRKTLLANISHDLKTPMTSIQGYIEAILEHPQQTEAGRQKYLQIILNNTVYMNKLIDDLFLFAKLDMAKLEFVFEVLPIRGFMNDLMEEFRLELEDQGICFTYANRLEEESLVKLDRKRIHQAFKNLIGNAIKYGPEQGLTLRAELYQEAMTPDWIWVSLCDNGPGIPEDKLAYVFERFYRLDNERTKDGNSTGLGLAIARELVEAHGGRIAVINLAEGGSCFKIGLPVFRAVS